MSEYIEWGNPNEKPAFEYMKTYSPYDNVGKKDYPAMLVKGSRVSQIYGDALEISERHRHRYEVNTAYKDRLEQHGLRFSGLSPDGVLPEIVEYEDHPWFIGVQYHPELKSRPFEPHPLFASFIQAAVVQSRLV